MRASAALACAEHAGRGAQFRLRLLGLQFEIDLVEGRERLAGNHEGADLNEALRHLSADTETQIAFDPRANGADKVRSRAAAT